LSEPATPLDRAQFLTLSVDLRPALHRYCARLTGSVFDGEDIVQDTFARALVAIEELAAPAAPAALRAWLFRIAHHRALDLLRARQIRASEPLDEAEPGMSDGGPDPREQMIGREAVETAAARFLELPVGQRSVVILKDVLGHSLDEISGMLDMTVNAVKAALARGRARLAQINAALPPPAVARPPSPAIVRYVALFNERNWDALRALLAHDVRLRQSAQPVLTGAGEVGMFFTHYAATPDWRLAPAWLEDHEVVAVFTPESGGSPAYVMYIESRDDAIVLIRDFRYTRYVVDGAEIVLATDPGPSGEPVR
jgi:RNA polymerase sigma-70 factor (ECF subfamily)